MNNSLNYYICKSTFVFYKKLIFGFNLYVFFNISYKKETNATENNLLKHVMFQF